MQVYEGTSFRPVITFKNATGVPTDPTTVTVKVSVGSTVTEYVYGTSPVIERTGVGVYRPTIPTTGSEYETWQVEVIGTGACAAVTVGGFMVIPRPF